MALATTRVMLLRDADANITVIKEEGGLLYDYDALEFFLLMAKAHLNEYIIADISDSTIRETGVFSPFGRDEEREAGLESWRRLLTFKEYLLPRSDSSAPVFLKDFNTIWGLAEREGLILGV